MAGELQDEQVLDVVAEAEEAAEGALEEETDAVVVATLEEEDVSGQLGTLGALTMEEDGEVVEEGL